MKTQLFILFFFTVLSVSAQNDTINQTDINNHKQGYWVICFKNTDKILEEGRFKDNNREGIWKQYFDDGSISSEITYTHDETEGPAKIYYPNGRIAEQGYWKKDTWVGVYKSYYKNGKLNYLWNFCEDGTRSGVQEYFYENGKKMISGQWIHGLESGVIKRYNEQGQLIEEQTYNNGVINEEQTVIHKVKPVVKPKKNIVVEKEVVEEPQKLEKFNATGERKLFDKKRRLCQEGYFEVGELIKGKKYYYNKEDQVIRTEIIKNGKVFKISDSKE